MTIDIIPMEISHLDAIWQIEQQAHSHPWKESMIRELDSRCAIHHTLLQNGEVSGYFYAQNVVGEITLLNIAVAPEKQGQGLGGALLEFLLAYGENAQAESLWLEVRASNQGAIHLYEKMGFNEIDRRRNYYPTASGHEDAIIMNCVLGFDFS